MLWSVLLTRAVGANLGLAFLLSRRCGAPLAVGIVVTGGSIIMPVMSHAHALGLVRMRTVCPGMGRDVEDTRVSAVFGFKGTHTGPRCCLVCS